MTESVEMPSDVELLTVQINSLATNIKKEKEAKRWALRVVAVILVVVFISLGLLWRQNGEIIQARSDGRVAACKVDNNFATNHNALVHAVQDLVTTVFHATSANRSPEVKAQVETFIGQLNVPLGKRVVPVRKCDRASVAKFYRNAK